MKILLVRNSPSKININSYNVQEIGLAKALIKKGNNVSIVFYSKKEYCEEVIDGIKIYFVPGKKFLNYVIYNKKIFDIAREYDIVQTSEYNQIMSYLFIKKYSNKTIIYHGPYYRKNFYSIVNNKIFDILFLDSYKKYNPIVLTKSQLAEDFLKNKGFKRVYTIGVGLDSEKFKKSIKCTNFLDILDKNKFNMISIGTIEKRKNTYFLLKVLKKLLTYNDNYHIFFVGKPIKNYKKKCLSFIKKNNLEKNVTFIDNIPQEQLKTIYESVDLFLLPSTYEIFGMVLLEAKYFNTPIISSYNGGASFSLNEENIVNKLEVDLWVKKIMNIKKGRSIYKNKKVLWDDLVINFEKKYIEVLKNEEIKRK